MEPLAFSELPRDALLLLDSAPIIYFLEGHHIAESAARLRASLGLKPADDVQAASALAANAAALVTHDRDFSRVRSLRIIS